MHDFRRLTRRICLMLMMLLMCLGGIAAEASGRAAAAGSAVTASASVLSIRGKENGPVVQLTRKKKKNKNRNSNSNNGSNNNYNNSNSNSNYSNNNNGNNSNKSNDTSSSGSSKSEKETEEIKEEGTYTSKEDVALYIHLFGHLPDNFITKNEARDLGWVSSEGNLDEVAPGKSIGGDRFGNYEGQLPDKKGRKYYECDIDYKGGYRAQKRIIYSNDGLVYYTEDHYTTFELLYE